MLIPLHGTHPVELGMGGEEAGLAARLEAEPRYVSLFAAAFPEEPKPIRLPNVQRAVACFERTLISGDSPYDRVVYQGKMDAMTEPAWRGMRLFFSDRLSCSRCHAGYAFSGPVDYVGTQEFDDPPEPLFLNTGLYNLNGRGAYPSVDTGLRDVTRRRRDMGRFKAPTLRNIALTAPYMHDGSIATLGEVVDHYAAGGRTIAHGPLAGVGRNNPAKDKLIHGFPMTPQNRADLLAFLESLTDESVIVDPRFSDPWLDNQWPR